jgi:hypothetical protein
MASGGRTSVDLTIYDGGSDNEALLQPELPFVVAQKRKSMVSQVSWAFLSQRTYSFIPQQNVAI